MPAPRAARLPVRCLAAGLLPGPKLCRDFPHGTLPHRVHCLSSVRLHMWVEVYHGIQGVHVGWCLLELKGRRYEAVWTYDCVVDLECLCQTAQV